MSGQKVTIPRDGNKEFKQVDQFKQGLELDMKDKTGSELLLALHNCILEITKQTAAMGIISVEMYHCKDIPEFQKKQWQKALSIIDSDACTSLSDKINGLIIEAYNLMTPDQ